MNFEDEKRKILKEILKDIIQKKLLERGIKCEILDSKKREEPDIILKSSGINIGEVFILLQDEYDLSFLKNIVEKTQVYLAFEKGREKEITSKLLPLGLAGKIKFITWEVKINFQ